MFRQGKKAIMGLAALAALGLGAGAVAQAGSSTSTAPPAANSAKAPAKAKPAATKSESQDARDTDNVQSGDQTTPDKADKPDGAGETGSEVPNADGPGGHADEPGSPNADHQFNGKE